MAKSVWTSQASWTLFAPETALKAATPSSICCFEKLKTSPFTRSVVSVASHRSTSFAHGSTTLVTGRYLLPEDALEINRAARTLRWGD